MTDRTSAENLLELLRTYMKSGGVEDFRQESAMILETVLSCTYTKIRAGLADDPSPQQIETAFQMATNRLAGAPIAHVLGIAHFYGRVFKINPGTLVPRHETEILVDTALNLLRQDLWSKPRVLDIYTGCGNILLTIAAETTIEYGLGIDRDAAAIDIAGQNLSAFKLGGIDFRTGEVSEELERLDRSFHLVTANPPYIPTAEIPELQKEISEHERWSALDGGVDGLMQYRMLAEKVRNAILPNGYFITEIGMDQQDRIARIFKDWDEIDFIDDLNGIPRVLKAKP